MCSPFFLPDDDKNDMPMTLTGCVCVEQFYLLLLVHGTAAVEPPLSKLAPHNCRLVVGLWGDQKWITCGLAIRWMESKLGYLRLETPQYQYKLICDQKL